ncbi:cytochrome b [Herbaspirillum sp. ST 5-3]|uniref:cytochrome b n=1 Tax=Oxalobacteraceae TaxID=75682 RepID=UPI0010A3402A|nr:cytochrome b [Herbaspirillum sp. ST 5-3]
MSSFDSANEWRYSRAAVVLHWLLAVLIASMAALGWYMMSIEDEPAGPWYLSLHKTLGILVFALVVVRVAWRVNHKPAELPASLPRWEVATASITHWLLYACMILVPVTGLLGASYSKSGVVFFGIQLPRWMVPNHDTAELLFSIHEALVWILVVLVVFHAVAALKHLLVNRDRVFQRMWF